MSGNEYSKSIAKMIQLVFHHYNGVVESQTRVSRGSLTVIVAQACKVAGEYEGEGQRRSNETAVHQDECRL